MSGGFSPSILNAIQNASIASKVITFQQNHSQQQPTLSEPSSNSITITDIPDPNGQVQAEHKHKFANRQLPLSALLYLATLGGADVCNLSSRIGSFETSNAFDALLVSVRSDVGNPGLWGVDTDEDLGIDIGGDGAELDGMLERFLFTGDDRNVRRVYVQGRWIGGADSEERN